ncbi:hypothetical protein [Okeania sp. KiyG1]|uniref:hypothetical protein n=1 Tax=Okeania sp. KiyG1 TaxID=2720165 RepID=UPI00192168A6|nr:hypothetical protein [Okeania sp. KiyG1]
MFDRKRLKLLPVKALKFNQQSNNYWTIVNRTSIITKDSDRFLSRVITIGQ